MTTEQPRYTDARCGCCDLPAYSCGKTADDKQRQQNAADRELLRSRGWREASFAGHCARCGEAFPIGDVIIYSRDGWVAQCCAGVS